MGRNHGLYNLLGFAFLILLTWYKGERSFLARRVFIWGLGILIGYSPMLFMLCAFPGLWESFLYITVASAKEPNMPFSPLWPWVIDFTILGRVDVFRNWVISGIMCVFLPLFYLVSLVIALRTSREDMFSRRVLIASIFIGIFYTHHFSVMSDINHLSQAIHPLLIGMVSLPSCFFKGKSKKIAFSIIGIILFVMTCAIASVSPLYKWLRSPEQYVEYRLGGDRLVLKHETTKLVDCIKAIDEQNFNKDDGIFIAPYWTIFYAILKRPAPGWGIYFTKPTQQKRQRSMIAGMEEKNVKWVILGDEECKRCKNKERYKFKNTTRLMWQHINENYTPVPAGCLPPNYRLLKKNEVK